jgi:plasmanylethanolamine desaturase
MICAVFVGACGKRRSANGTSEARDFAEPATLLPTVDPLGRLRRTISFVAILTAVALLAWQIHRLSTAAPAFGWWLLPAIFAGALAADFLSGLIHWAADTWGDVRMPLVGSRVLHPFRVHHVNPDDFLSRRFLDANGEVAMLIVPALAGALTIPLESRSAMIAAVFLASLCGIGLWTNQIHQWAHMTRPPAVVRALQACRLILSRPSHMRHHRLPYTDSYCITTGWCNRPLAAIGFYACLERVISRLTGIPPRLNEAEFHERASAGTLRTAMERGHVG